MHACIRKESLETCSMHACIRKDNDSAVSEKNHWRPEIGDLFNACMHQKSQKLFDQEIRARFYPHSRKSKTRTVLMESSRRVLLEKTMIQLHQKRIIGDLFNACMHQKRQ
mmetsp:Transcript_8403/g.15800  ORF Transcript_8403/g.15800 Transcript_8403/m.15800 type:complete len:110 (+) Transcript_8403:443-772(+)